jgi:hypothetical protein
MEPSLERKWEAMYFAKTLLGKPNMTYDAKIEMIKGYVKVRFKSITENAAREIAIDSYQVAEYCQMRGT